jgi:hypothetical protein
MMRWSGEAVFLSSWRSQIMGSRYPVHPAYLEPCGWQPNPQLPKITALHLNQAALDDEFFPGYFLNHKLPVRVSQRNVSERCVRTVEKINWLDPMRY